MSFKGEVIYLTAKMTRSVLHVLTSGGSSLPGKIAKKMDPAILGELAEGYDVIVITGTNGKTTTTALTRDIFSTTYPVLSNPTGSNMEQGIIAAFLDRKRRKEKKFAILEVDEASLRYVTEYVKPKLIVITNIFRDQMDRYGEIYTTYNFILEAAKKSPETPLLVNGDLPLFAKNELKNPRLYYGFANEDKETDLHAFINSDGILCPVCDHVLHYHMITYSSLGDYFCPNCGFTRPKLNYEVTAVKELTTTSSSFEIDGKPFKIPVAGQYNLYNALTAYAIARYFGFDVDTIQDSIAHASRTFGRQEVIKIGEHELIINLMKNPVGFNQLVDILGLEEDDFTLVSILNDRPADGQDVSWIWDGEFERLAQQEQIKKTYYGGLRQEDLRKRLVVSGFDEQALEPFDDIEGAIQAIQEAPTQKVYLLATYTAMLNLRKALAEHHYIKERLKA